MTADGPVIQSPGSSFYDDPPSREILLKWLETNGIFVHPALMIVDMDEGDGWMIESAKRIAEGELLLSAPKPSLLSPRTSSLYPHLPAELTHPPSSSSSISVAASTNHAILVFALCILHELRLGEESRWYGYLQSLPRPADVQGLLPVFWSREASAPAEDALSQSGTGASEDTGEAYSWLRGTDAWGDLRRREREGMGLSDIVSFWRNTSSLLAPTASHPSPATFSDFTYAYTLLSTRAFVVDIYHHTALVPFADILNHSAFPHTSLASDDFVCHLCGSMPLCVHDAVDMDRVPARLAHVHPEARKRLMGTNDKEAQEDTVEMRADREIGKMQEVKNTYGDHMSDGRLLVEYGFIGEEYAGEGIRLEEQRDLEEAARGRWLQVLHAMEEVDLAPRPTDTSSESAGLSNAFTALDMDDARPSGDTKPTTDEEEEDDTLLYKPKTFRIPSITTTEDSTGRRSIGPDDLGLHLSHAGQVSVPLFALITLTELDAASDSQGAKRGEDESGDINSLARRVRNLAEGLEAVHASISHDDDETEEGDASRDELAAKQHNATLARMKLALDLQIQSPEAVRLAVAVRAVLQDRLSSMHEPEADLTELFEKRDGLPEERTRTRLAMTLSINERVLLITAAHKWTEVIDILEQRA